MRVVLLLLLSLTAAIRPLTRGEAAVSTPPSFPGWPARLIGAEVHELELSPREAHFAKDFPGKVAKFSDGQRDFIVRWITKESRKLHPAADCMRGAGYSIQPLPIRKDAQGKQWGCASARRGTLQLRVCEQIEDQAGHSWSDVSAWFWAAFLRRSEGPWWSVTLIERA